MGKVSDKESVAGYNRGSYVIRIAANIILILLALMCVIPFFVVLAASFSSESELLVNGYGLFPKGFTLDAYKIVFANGEQIVSAYFVTIWTTAIGSALSLLVMSLAANALSRTDYKWRNVINFYFYFTMIFSGGAISTYMWITQGLHLRNNPMVLILPMLVNAGHIFLLRTYMSKVPREVIESVKIDGGGEFTIFVKFIVPMTMVGIATIFVMTILAFWNQWYACLMYMNDDHYITIQYYMMRVLSSVEAILKSENAISNLANMDSLPSETVRMALCVLAAGPMVFVFSFFQKYFAGGIALGSVKG